MERVYITVVNQNYVADIPHQDIPDTDLTCIVKARQDYQYPSRTVTYKDLQAARLTDEELFELAYPSISPEHFCIRSIEQAISECVGEELAADVTSDISHQTIYVVSSKEGLDGASILANPVAMQSIQSRFGGGELIVIPNSVHEILIIRTEDAPDVQELNQIIHEINQREVREDERLADHAFTFNGHLSIANIESQDRETEHTSKKERFLSCT